METDSAADVSIRPHRPITGKCPECRDTLQEVTDLAHTVAIEGIAISRPAQKRWTKLQLQQMN